MASSMPDKTFDFATVEPLHLACHAATEPGYRAMAQIRLYLDPNPDDAADLVIQGLAEPNEYGMLHLTPRGLNVWNLIPEKLRALALQQITAISWHTSYASHVRALANDTDPNKAAMRRRIITGHYQHYHAALERVIAILASLPLCFQPETKEE